MMQAGDTVKCFSESQLDEYIKAYRGLGYTIKKDAENCRMIITKGFEIPEDKKEKVGITWNNLQEGNRLKYMRTAIYFQVNEVAAEVGVSRQRVREWEQGINLPEGNVLQRLCELFECDEEYITEGKGRWVIR